MPRRSATQPLDHLPDFIAVVCARIASEGMERRGEFNSPVLQVNSRRQLAGSSSFAPSIEATGYEQ